MVDSEIVDNTAQSRFELTVDGHTAYLSYERTQEADARAHRSAGRDPRAARRRSTGRCRDGGRGARRVFDFEFHDIPQGRYEVTGTLTGTDGRRVEVTRVFMVLSRTGR